MYDDEEKKPRLAYLVLGMFFAFAVYGTFGAEMSVTLMILALPIILSVGLVSCLIRAFWISFVCRRNG